MWKPPKMAVNVIRGQEAAASPHALEQRLQITIRHIIIQPVRLLGILPMQANQSSAMMAFTYPSEPLYSHGTETL